VLKESRSLFLPRTPCFFFRIPSKKMEGQDLKRGDCRFLSRPSQFITESASCRSSLYE
jgi:hypothetical protein